MTTALNLLPGYRYYRARGAASKLQVSRNPEILIEGPAGTGKTRGVLEKVKRLCDKYPIRVLFVRQTRKSLTDSVLVEWEKILGDGHPAIHGRAGRAHRSSYRFPSGAEVVLFGLENPERTYSAQYDLIICFEAHEIPLDAYEKLYRANRNFAIPWQQIICDTNPASEYHWLNQRWPGAHEAQEPGAQMQRLISVHKDNPLLWNEEAGEWTPEGQQYMARLEKLTGARRARLLEGRWVSEEGQVWESFQPTTHLRDYEDVKDRLKWYYGGCDWGYRNPGWLGIFGVDEDDNSYLVAEWYHSERDLEWWKDVWVQAWHEFLPNWLVCDPSRPDCIELFNTAIWDQHPSVDACAIKARNEWVAGAALVRWGFEQQRLFICRGALRHSPDPLLVDRNKPTCLAQEIPSYVFRKADDGKPIKEEPDPVCEDHACDGLRYAFRWKWQRDEREIVKQPMFEEGSMGDVMGHADVYRAMRGRG